jgi:hypothetical protein
VIDYKSKKLVENILKLLGAHCPSDNSSSHQKRKPQSTTPMELPISFNDCKKSPINGLVMFIALACTVVVIVLVCRSQTEANNPCVPLKQVPSIGIANLLTAEEERVFAKAGGYLEIFDDETTYLPLNFHTVTRDKLYDGPMVVTLVGDCVTLDIKYINGSSENSRAPPVYSYKGVELLVRNGRRTNKVHRKICEFQNQLKFDQPNNLRYSCRQTRNHICSSYVNNQTYKQKANLVLTIFELELDGDPAKGGLDKAPLARSCERWMDHQPSNSSFSSG